MVIEYSRTNGWRKSGWKKRGGVEKLNEKMFSFWKISFLENLCDCDCNIKWNLLKNL